MSLRPLRSFAKYGSPAVAIVAAVLFLSGCGEADDGKQFSQDFEKPAGAPAAKADPGVRLSASEIRRKEIEDSKREPVGKGKGQRQR